MPRVIFAAAAIRDLRRLQDFLRPLSPDAARRAGEAIWQGTKILASHPRIGRTVENLPETIRERLVDFGNSGYVIRYLIDSETVTIIAVRHQRKAGFVPFTPRPAPP